MNRTFKPEKIEKVITKCAEGLNVDLDKFQEKLVLFLKPKMTTAEIQKNLINAAVSLISTEENKLDYSKFAARLMLVDFRRTISTLRKNKFPESHLTLRGHFYVRYIFQTFLPGLYRLNYYNLGNPKIL